jgi:hypothetical protein
MPGRHACLDSAVAPRTSGKRVRPDALVSRSRYLLSSFTICTVLKPKVRYCDERKKDGVRTWEGRVATRSLGVTSSARKRDFRRGWQTRCSHNMDLCSVFALKMLPTASQSQLPVQRMPRALTLTLDITKHTLSSVDSCRHGYLLHTLGQDCIPNRLEFRILLRPSKPLCHFCIGVAAPTCGTNIFQHHRNYISRACGAALASQNSAGDPLPISVLTHSTSGMGRQRARQCFHSCPDAVLITYLPLPSAKRTRLCDWTVTGYSLGEWSGN